MSRIACVERIYDALVGEGLSTEHACFDDLVMGCAACAVDPIWKGREVVEWIADMDGDRDEVAVALDIKEYFVTCGNKKPVADVLPEIVAAGEAGWMR